MQMWYDTLVMIGTTLSRIAGLTVLLFVGIPARGQDSDDNLKFFEKRIRPVLVEHCYECHSKTSDPPQGGLRLDTRDAIRRGGDSGPAVVPGDVDASQIIAAMRHESFEMPPDKQLPAAIIEHFSTWIAAGAPDPRESTDSHAPQDRQEIDVSQAKSRWPFTELQPPTQPRLSNPMWPDNPADYFVLASIESAGLSPTHDALRRTFLRRVTLELIGLPPTPDDARSFENDIHPDAHARLVDRLLASPAFAERWARHWLDVARYADSSGGGRATIYPNAWRYRDYVFDAFNRDLPYDQFLAEQIAGDLLDSSDWNQRRRRIAALGFLAVGPKNLDTQDKELLRMDVVDEQLDTIGQALLGMTLGCARCHDHKFDPIPTSDYYALAGILRSTKTLLPGNVSGFVELDLPLDPSSQKRFDAYARKQKKRNAELAKARQQLATLRAELLSLGTLVDDRQAQIEGSWTESTSVPSFVGKSYLHDGDRNKGRSSITFTATPPKAGTYEVWLAYSHGSNRAKQVGVAIHTKSEKHRLYIDQTKPAEVGELFQPIGQFQFAAEPVTLVVNNTQTKGHVVADAILLVHADDLQHAKQSVIAPINDCVNTIQKILEQEKALAAAAPPKPQKAMAVQEEEKIEDCPVLIRGNAHSPGEVAPRGFLTVTLRSSPPTIPDDQSGRLQLVQWLTSRENPLTARVMANRIWLHLFGRGIVTTPDNFGIRGEQPTHPELLDEIATDFIRRQWSVKSLIRDLVTSHTYRLSTEQSPNVIAKDPQNRLLTRHNRRPLEVEVLRDSMLAIAGTLEPSVGGASVRTGTASEFDYEFATRRRSIYIPVFRANLYDMFDIFDFADPNLVVGMRTRTTLPTQALFWMNSPFVSAQAAALALDLSSREDLTDSQRLIRAFELVLGRNPSEAERQRFLDELQSLEPSDNKKERQRVWQEIVLALFASIDFRYNS